MSRRLRGWLWLGTAVSGLAFMLVSLARWFQPALFSTELAAGLLTTAMLAAVIVVGSDERD